ncbi:MAG TPA: PilZ domain-containing protein [Candidatus Acidoferrales bacterium]|nr:PilZ domain-containing protein [Candidatus Acidoferrales bacterium]
MPKSSSTSRQTRGAPRFTFIATAHVLEPVSEVRLSGRISEISAKGCYVDVLNALPVGTEVGVRITRDKGTFAASARVIYVQEGMGMGLLFTGMQADQAKVLESWLAELGT